MLRGTTDQRGPKAPHQKFYIVQLLLMTRKREVENGDKIKSKCPHLTLNIVQLPALKRATAEIIEKSRLVTDNSVVQTQMTGKSPLQISMLSAIVILLKTGKGLDCQRIIKRKRIEDVKMKSAESIRRALRQRQAENARNRNQKNRTKLKWISVVRKEKKRHKRP